MDASVDLSRRERQIMQILYRRKGATVAEVMDEMRDPPSYSAVRSTLRILVEKGHAWHREDGPRYVYLPTVPVDSARSQALDRLVETFFGGSASRAVMALLDRSAGELSDEELERLADLIMDARAKGQ